MMLHHKVRTVRTEPDFGSPGCETLVCEQLQESTRCRNQGVGFLWLQEATTLLDELDAN